MEKLYELHQRADFDLVVVDTPPTRNALDFLEAPRRLTRLLENRVFRLLMMPTRTYLKAASFAVQTLLRTVSKVVGAEVIDDVVEFFRTFEGMEEGFRKRARTVDELLADERTSFVLVTSPRRDALEEAHFFALKLAENDVDVDGLIVNRLHPRFGTERPEGLEARAATLMGGPPQSAGGGAGAGGPAAQLGALYRNLAELDTVAERERAQLAGLADRIGSASVAEVPFLAVDVCDFSGLHAIGELVFADGRR